MEDINNQQSGNYLLPMSLPPASLNPTPLYQDPPAPPLPIQNDFRALPVLPSFKQLMPNPPPKSKHTERSKQLRKMRRNGVQTNSRTKVWTPEETSELFIAIINASTAPKSGKEWDIIAKNVSLNRTGSSCKKKYLYMKKTELTLHEYQHLIESRIKNEDLIKIGLQLPKNSPTQTTSAETVSTTPTIPLIYDTQWNEDKNVELVLAAIAWKNANIGKEKIVWNEIKINGNYDPSLLSQKYGAIKSYCSPKLRNRLIQSGVDEDKLKKLGFK
jgi:Myb-like DNA-binding domain